MHKLGWIHPQASLSIYTYIRQNLSNPYCQNLQIIFCEKNFHVINSGWILVHKK